MRAVSSGYGGDSEPVSTIVPDELTPVTTEAIPEVPLAVAEEVTTKRSVKTKTALASVFATLGAGAASLLGL